MILFFVKEKSVLGSFEFDFNDSIEGSEPLPDLVVNGGRVDYA